MLMKHCISEFRILLLLFSLLTACQQVNSSRNSGIIHTIDGPVEVDQLKFTLTHEHLMSNFGKAPDEAAHYDDAALLSQVIPYLRKIKSLGINSILDCTTAYFGRRVDLLKKMADSTGIQIVTNTGFYGAADDRYVPEFAFGATAEEISNVWIEEFEEGIDGSEVRPGFVKLAFDDGMPSEIDKKLFTAGILTHLNTGLTLAVHTGNNPEAVTAQLELLSQHRVRPDAWVWVHAHLVENVQLLLNAASLGAWISLDGAKESNVEEYINKIKKFKSENLLHKILLSHDGDGFPMGGEIREFEAIPRHLIPAMLANGFTEKEVEQIMVRNPKEAFMIRTRRRE
jgi:predicted metal-dependent phosphotriesterase family hydrolase